MKQTEDFAIKLTGVSKKYIVHHEKPTLVEKVIKTQNESFWALRNITLTIRKGERVGIIGSNGSGKTTLLKTIAGISVPSAGYVETTGKLVSLIDAQAGFHPDLTGYQNIYLNGMLLGMKKQEIQAQLDRIVRFAGVGKFIDVPLHTYSQGMQLRLGFSVALYTKPDIILLDESLDTGDLKFKQKVKKTIDKHFQQKTLVLVTHNLYSVIDFCTRILIMHKGRFIYDGGLEAIFRYQKTKDPGIFWYLRQKRQADRLAKRRSVSRADRQP
jgi:lipopolysaccharide transport system ATP-binding protein